MTARQQWIAATTIVVILLGSLGVCAFVMRDDLFPVEVGSRAPAFSARTIDGTGRLRTLADYKGKVLILNVWATWCGPCLVEMPSFERLHKMMPDTNLKIVAVSVDDVVGMDSVRSYARNVGMTFEVLLDSMHTIDRDYQVVAYPETFVIARDGTIRKKWIGPAEWTSPGNLALVRELLAQ
jgi:peroxiredoxin